MTPICEYSWVNWLLFGALGFTFGISAYAAVRSAYQLTMAPSPHRKMWLAVLLLSIVGVSVAVGYLHDVYTRQLLGRGHDVVTIAWTIGNCAVASAGYWLVLKYEARRRREASEPRG